VTNASVVGSANLIPFPNHPCTLSASLAVRQYCPRFAFAGAFDFETEWRFVSGWQGFT
jgi:hypothetical protein